MSGMLASSRTSSNGRLACAAAVSASSAAASARHRGRRHPPAADLLGENAPVDVVVVDNQHVEMRRAAVRPAAASGASVTSSATVK